MPEIESYTYLLSPAMHENVESEGAVERDC